MPIDLREYGKDYADAVLAEIVAASSQPAATLDDVYGHVEHLWNEASARNDQQALEVIAGAWEKIRAISEHHDHSVSLAAAARAVAETLKEQRDVAVEQFEDLEAAVSYLDTTNPLVEQMVERVEENFVEGIQESGAYISTDPAEDTVELAELPITYDDASDLHMFMSGMLWQNQDIDEIYYRELAEEFAHFAGRFCEKLRRAMASTEDARQQQRAQARREFMMALSGGMADDDE